MQGTGSILHWLREARQVIAPLPRGCSLAALGVALCLLAACEAPMPRGPDMDQRYDESRARQLARSGRHEQAAELFEQTAERSDDAGRLWLAAAREWHAAGAWSRVIQALANIDGELAAGQSVEHALLGASAHLHLDNIEAAETWVAELPETPSDRARPAVLWVRIRLALARGDYAAAAALNTEREMWLSRSEDVLAGRRALLAALQARHRREPLPPAAGMEDPLAAGWIGLARIIADADRDPFVVRSSLREWGLAFGEHPGEALLPELLAGYRRMLDYPSQIAVLLPVSGRLQAAGEAVRDGLVAAYLRHDSERPQVRFYDVGQDSVADTYGRAVLDGAEFVIGPLTRDAVLELAGPEPVPVPTLVLNNLPAEAEVPAGIYQFGLTPEDEARQAARRVLQDGLVQGIALVPANEWGERMLQAFSGELEQSGGVLLDFAQYDPREQDFTGPITGILHLAESHQRHRALSGVLGRRIEFEPRRRRDVQYIFLAASADVGRLMRPQLRFHYASRLPVYATSSVYRPEPDRNGDLNGVMFTDIPWAIDDNEETVALRGQLEDAWPRGMGVWPRLYALGFDAYRLVPPLFSGQLSEGQTVSGLTGELSLDDNGRITRGLMWARFDGGIPVRMPDSPAAAEAAVPDLP